MKRNFNWTLKQKLSGVSKEAPSPKDDENIATLDRTLNRPDIFILVPPIGLKNITRFDNTLIFNYNYPMVVFAEVYRETT